VMELQVGVARVRARAVPTVLVERQM
jgi:hypothetical protein